MESGGKDLPPFGDRLQVATAWSKSSDLSVLNLCYNLSHFINFVLP